MGKENMKSIVEALLFASNEPLKPREAKEILAGKGNLGEGKIKKLIEELREEYEGARVV